MPWILTAIGPEGQYQYKVDERVYAKPEWTDTLPILNNVADELNEIKSFDDFLKEQSFKPITFTLTHGENQTEEKTLAGDETYEYLDKRKYPFKELGRMSESHLMFFAIKNGMTVEDIDLIKNRPDDPQYQEKLAQLEAARKEMYEFGCSDYPADKTEQTAQLYVDYIKNLLPQLERLKTMDQAGNKDMIQFAKLANHYQSLFIQTMNIDAPHEEQRFGKKVFEKVDELLEAENIPFTADKLGNFGNLANYFAQSAKEMKAKLNEFAENGVNSGEAQLLHIYTSKVLYGMKCVREQLAQNKPVAQTIGEFTEAVGIAIADKWTKIYFAENVKKSDPQAVADFGKEDIAIEDMILERQIKNPVPSKNFIKDFNSLLESGEDIDFENDSHFSRLHGFATDYVQRLSQGLSPEQKDMGARLVMEKARILLGNEQNPEHRKFAENVMRLVGTEVLTEKKGLDRNMKIEPTKESFKQNADIEFGEISLLAKELDAVDPKYIRSSDSFRNTKTYLGELKEQLNAYRKNPTEQGLNDIRMSCKRVADSSAIYLFEKQEKQQAGSLSKLGKQRFDFMKKLNSITAPKATSIAKIAERPFKTNAQLAESMKTEANDIIRMEGEKAKPDYKRVKEGLVGLMYSSMLYDNADLNAECNIESIDIIKKTISGTKDIAKQLSAFKQQVKERNKQPKKEIEEPVIK